MLELKNLYVSYDKKQDVIKDLSLTIPSGEWVGIIGRSGSGKSTLLRSIHLFTKTRSGSIKLDGTEMTTLHSRELRRIRRKIAFIFQDYNLIDSLTVLENVLTSRLGYQSPLQSLIGKFSEEDYKRAQKAISRVGLEEKIFEKAKNLSGGQKQRVAIAKALCQDADLILADEPVSSLDQGTTIQIMEYFKLIHEKKHKTILINLHNVELAKKYCQRIVAIDAGRIIYDGTPGNLDEKTIQALYE